MSFPWFKTSRRAGATDRLVFSWSGTEFAYARASAEAGGPWQVQAMGVLRTDSDDFDVMRTQIQPLGLRAFEVHALLRPAQYQMLQIPTPPVPEAELRAAARFQIRDMVDLRLDELTLDVMRVGDPHPKDATATSQLYVVVAATAELNKIQAMAKALHWTLEVIDVHDTAQRNLQHAAAQRAGLGAAATALLMVHNERQALLTVCANGELYFSRRLDLPEGFLDMEWEQAPEAATPEPTGYTPVQEYVPEYAAGSPDYGALPLGGVPSGHERAQRVLVEVQRSIDLWDRTWSALPLGALQVSALARSEALAAWLGQEMGQTVTALDWTTAYPALAALSVQDRMLCLPLLGALLRDREPTP